MSVLEAQGLVKVFGGRAVVKDVDLSIRTGEIAGLLGRNGAGKTTTFLMIAGLLRPDAGRLSLDGKDISLWTTVQRAEKGITYLPQEGSVFLKESVLGNLLMILELQGLSEKERTAAARALLEELGLQDLAAQPAYSLSGGERRRLEICRALVLGPHFLLLDEPFTGIDPLTILELQKIFLRLKNRNIGIVVSDHNVHDTFKIVDRAFIIDEGGILMEGPPDILAADAQVREKFLGSSFRYGGEGPINPLNPAGPPAGLPKSPIQPVLPFDAVPETETENGALPKSGETTGNPPDPDPDPIEEYMEESQETLEHTKSEDPESSVEDGTEQASARISGIFGILMSRAFDLLFVAVIWIVSAFFASRLMEKTFFELISASCAAFISYYAALVALYFLLFRYLLGWTLGDDVFRRRNPR